jgi:hypothetical protein
MLITEPINWTQTYLYIDFLLQNSNSGKKDLHFVVIVKYSLLVG